MLSSEKVVAVPPIGDLVFLRLPQVLKYGHLYAPIPVQLENGVAGWASLSPVGCGTVIACCTQADIADSSVGPHTKEQTAFYELDAGVESYSPPSRPQASVVHGMVALPTHVPTLTPTEATIALHASVPSEVAADYVVIADLRS